MHDGQLLKATSTESPARQSMKGVATDIRSHANRLRTLVQNLNMALVNSGIKSADPMDEPGDAPEPADMLWILNDADGRLRQELNTLEGLIGLLDAEIV